MKSKNYTDYLKENFMSNVIRYAAKYDCVCISAFRDGPGCGPDELTPEEEKNYKYYTKNENLARNKSLNAKLSVLGYGITSAVCIFIQNSKIIFMKVII